MPVWGPPSGGPSSLSFSALAFVLLAATSASGGQRAGPPGGAPLALIDVPYLTQSESLCGGAAAAMVLRFWGERGLTAESFAHLVDRSAAGIRTTALVGELRRRGWAVEGVAGTPTLLEAELARGRPVMALIEDRPAVYHYVVVVGATATAVVFHDPARTPFRAMPRAAFEKRWNEADRWMAVVTPNPTAGLPSPVLATRIEPGATTPCERRVSQAVAAAQANDLAAAEGHLLAVLGCAGASRELAGLRLLQRRWPEVAELAEAAVAESPDDLYAWRLLGTSRFVQDETQAALEAWNRAGEPRVDTISVLGLERTRQRAVEELLQVTPGALLTPDLLVRTGRRLAELPAAATANLLYVPVAGGLAELRGTVVERPLFPSGSTMLAGIAVRTAARREIEVPFGSLTGGGERLTAGWRFWSGRPRVSLAFEAPTPGWSGIAGVVAVDAAVERQPFDAAFDPARRWSAGLSLSAWSTARVRLSARTGVDRWRDAGSFASGAFGVRYRTLGDRLEAAGEAHAWRNARSGFGSVSADLNLRSSAVRRGRVYAGRGGLAVASVSTPPDLWFGGDTGHVREVVLRAHPLLTDGRLTTERLGRRIVHASAEASRWWRAPLGLQLGAALFVDTARVFDRASPGARGDVDVGAGARAALPGLPGVLRLDIGQGLRDGATAVSVVYTSR